MAIRFHHTPLRLDDSHGCDSGRRHVRIVEMVDELEVILGRQGVIEQASATRAVVLPTWQHRWARRQNLLTARGQPV